MPYKALGPFYGRVPVRYREAVDAHIHARHRVFELIDRVIGEQLIRVLKADTTSEEIVAEAEATVERATKFWMEGKREESCKALLAALTRILFLLECVEVEKSKPSSP